MLPGIPLFQWAWPTPVDTPEAPTNTKNVEASSEKPRNK
jgi:hypothetical protein